MTFQTVVLLKHLSSKGMQVIHIFTVIHIVMEDNHCRSSTNTCLHKFQGQKTNSNIYTTFIQDHSLHTKIVKQRELHTLNVTMWNITAWTRYMESSGIEILTNIFSLRLNLNLFVCLFNLTWVCMVADQRGEFFMAWNRAKQYSQIDLFARYK